MITGQIKQQYWENNLIANEDETLSCKDKIQKKKLCKIFTTWSQGK